MLSVVAMNIAKDFTTNFIIMQRKQIIIMIFIVLILSKEMYYNKLYFCIINAL